MFVICRRGNDSQVAVKLLKDHLGSKVKDISGGLTEWANTIDTQFPIY